MKKKRKAMFMDVLRIDRKKRLVILDLLPEWPDGKRPEVDGERLEITLPLEQFGPRLDELVEACGD